MLSWSLFVRIHTGRNDWSCRAISSTFHADLLPSVFLSFALPVENVWLIKIFQFLLVFLRFHVRVFLFRMAFFFSLRNWQKCIHSCILGFISLFCECVIALFENKYISCYLFINMRWCFSSNNFLICCYISCTFCSYVSFFSGCFRRWGNQFWTFICIKSGQAAQIHDEISCSKLNQSSFLCFKRSLLCQLVVSFWNFSVDFFFFFGWYLIMKTWIAYKWGMEFEVFFDVVSRGRLIKEFTKRWAILLLNIWLERLKIMKRL